MGTLCAQLFCLLIVYLPLVACLDPPDCPVRESESSFNAQAVRRRMNIVL